eukprot:1234988-Rhodomonas_salina.1
MCDDRRTIEEHDSAADQAGQVNHQQHLATSGAHEEVQPGVESQAEGPEGDLDTLGDHSDTDHSCESERPDFDDERGG